MDVEPRGPVGVKTFSSMFKHLRTLEDFKLLSEFVECFELFMVLMLISK